MSRDVTLDDGRVITGVPDNYTDEQVKNAYVGVQPDQPIPESSALDYVDMGGGIAGGLGGAMAGTAMGGPVGGIVGGVVGGALGTFGGNLLENQLKGEDLDYYNAMKETLIGIGFDMALLGVGNRAKAVWQYVSKLRAQGADPKQAAQAVESLLGKEAAPAGTQQSLKETQEFLESQGATLTPAMVKASGLRQFQQRIAELGILSSGKMTGNMNRIDDAVQGTLTNMLSPTAQLSKADASSLGSAMMEVINGGRRAIFDQYERGMDEILAGASSRPIDMPLLYKDIKSYMSGKTVTFKPIDPDLPSSFSKLQPETQKFLNSIESVIGNAKTGTVPQLIALEKRLLNEIRQYGDINSGAFNSQVFQELTSFQDHLKKAIRTGIASVDPKAAERYIKLQKEYSTSIGGLIPELTKTQIQQANKGNFTALGTVLTTTGNVDKVRALMHSIDSAYSKVDKNILKTMPFKNAKEAKKAVRDGFMMNLFPDLMSPKFTVDNLGKLAANLGKPDNVARLKVIMGEDYNAFRRMLNIMEEAQVKPESNVFALALRSKEAQAISTGAAGLTGFAAGGVATAAPLVAVFLGTPMLMAKAATNPKTIHRLIKLNENTKLTPYEKMQMFNVIVDDVMNSLTKEERDQYINEFTQMQPEGA